ncbi:MAG: DUF4126 domain-containing protein [Gemmatimonadota bacterium]
MTGTIIGQILGVGFACGLNLYLTVASLGILSRTGLITLPHGLQGLEGGIVIGSAAVMFLIEAVIDKVHHADSIWDAIHTFVRPPAAALLAIGVLWAQPTALVALGAVLAFGAALAIHGTKAGLRLARNASLRSGSAWISLGEDLLAFAFATAAFLQPRTSLIAGVAVLAALLLVGPRYWRASRLGFRCVDAWLRSLFKPGRWREGDEIPRRARSLLGPPPLGSAPPRATRAALHGLRSAGAYRNGWLVLAPEGPTFIYATLFGSRRVDLPAPRTIETTGGPWADTIHVHSAETDYRLFILKDGPAPDVAITHLYAAAA